ncbi:MAG: SDR family oxidoreductase [Proteobacteria bacterium]|nr:SDR family oxidoreductase [Pseudomonadota bacterium]MCC6631505.1 SDR family oxidoreductase [Gammaproteobacteria bacterium]
MNPFDLSGRRALITGASRGIGHAIATALASAGAHVIINGRTQAALDEAAAVIRATGARVDVSSFDVTDATQVNAGVDAIEAHFGPLDILVNNAGIQRRGPLDKFTDADWHALVAHNLDSVFFVGRAVARHMIPRGRGKIINIGSVQCELARPTIAPYTATKGAVRNLTRGMCADWAGHGLQINAICPGYFDTPLNKALVENSEFDSWLRKRTPAGRWGRLEDLHGAAVFLASRASDFVNGQMLYVDGGITAVI